MKVILQKEQQYFLRLDKGEELIESLKNFCKDNKIKSGSFQAIGATCELTLCYFNLNKKEYEDRQIKENLEITSLLGNIAGLDNEIIVHAHGTFAKNDLSVIGGHIKKVVVSVTCEMSLQIFEDKMERKPNEEMDLFLLK